MNKIILVLMLTVLLVGCVEQTIVKENKEYKVVEEDKVEVATFNVRFVNGKMDPEFIEVNLGQDVELSVTNEDNETEIFMIDDYSIDEQIADGATTIIKFKADKEGSFFYGDLSKENVLKGRLIVK